MEGNGHNPVQDRPAPADFYDGIPNPDATAEIEEQQGNVFREKAHWQLATLIAAGIILICVGVIAALALRPAYVPVYVVQNEEGQFRVLEWDEYNPRDAEIKADLMHVIRCYRELDTSRALLQRCWTRLPFFLQAGSQAMAHVDAHFKAIQPYQNLFKQRIELLDLTGYRDVDGTWRFHWKENIYKLSAGGGPGTLINPISVPYHASLVYTRVTPTKKEQMELNREPVNPRGVLVTHLRVTE